MTEYPSDPQPKLDLVEVREVLAGYAIANECMEAELIEQLASMTDDEARATDRDLYTFWAGLPAWTKEGLEHLEPLQLESLLATRQAFEQMAVAQGVL
jgi:hypothetical protein